MKKLLFAIYLVTTFVLFSCEPKEDRDSMGPKLNISDLTFDAYIATDVDSNTIVLKNTTSGVVPLFDYGTGKTTKQIDTIHFAFKGTYKIYFYVLTEGGFVGPDSVSFTLTKDNLKYVNDPLWSLLTGGIGNSKTWILDNGKYGFAVGPQSWGNPGASDMVWGDFKFNWEPADADNKAIAADYQAEMTFELINGPYLTTVKPNETGGGESGTFFLDVANHTLTTTGATIIRVAHFIPNADNWTSNVRVLALTENQLRIAIMRTNSEGPWWYVVNYVSKEYAANYKPAFVPDPNFNFGDQLAFLAGSFTTTWKFATNTPFNWTDLNGAFLNVWDSITHYPGWTGYDASAVSGIDKVRLTFYKTGDVLITKNDLSEEMGSFSINESKNLITFDGITPSIYISGGWVYASTTSYVEDLAGNVITGENQWKIVKRKTIAGVTTEVWFGKRDPGKKEYMVYHFILEAGIPDVEKEMIKGLCGKATGTSSRTYRFDVNHPVDWTNLKGENGWTVPGFTEGWYWSADIAASVKTPTITFSQTDGVVTVTKKDADGVITTSPVTIDGATRKIYMPDTEIIDIGGGSWLSTAGPNYYWVKGELNEVATNGLWIGVIDPGNSNQIINYHYILK